MQKSYHKIINYKGIYYYNFKKNILIKNSNLINALNVEDNVRKFEICQDNKCTARSQQYMYNRCKFNIAKGL